jgi:hypothetical protein
MKSIYVTFEDKDFKKLERAKKKSGKTWPEFILTLAPDPKEKKE